MSPFDEQRRNFLIKALGWGVFASSATGLSVPAWAMGQIPDELPPGRSIYKLDGQVTIDGAAANLDTQINVGSIIKTGENGTIIFAVGSDAFILRNNGKLEMQGNNLLLSGFRLVTGKLLSVFGKRKQNSPLKLHTVVATIGVRGTGVYLESEAEQTYVCTCYGTADLVAVNDASSKETVVTNHHDSPRYIIAAAAEGKKIQQAPVINHTDEELELIETLVGRSVPFGASGNYDSMRKNKY